MLEVVICLGGAVIAFISMLLWANDGNISSAD